MSLLMAKIIDYIMRRFFILTACFFMTGLSIAQTTFPFIEEGKIWADLILSGGTPPPGGGQSAWTNSYKFEGDTVIQGKEYHLMYLCEKDSTLTNWVREDYFYREDSNKIYELDWFGNEIQIYNFDLEVGDSMLIDPFYGYAYVIAVDSTLIAGDYRKTIHFDDPEDIWIAGLGSLHSTFDPLLSFFIAGNMFELLCVTDTGGQLYQNPSYDGCYIDTLLTGKDEINPMEPGVMIFPNPMEHSCNIRITGTNDSSGTIMLFDNLGRLVREEPFCTNSIIFEHRNLAPGCYFMQIQGKVVRLTKNIMVK